MSIEVNKKYVIGLCNDGYILQAVKYVRDITGFTLFESKEIVDKIKREYDPRVGTIT